MTASSNGLKQYRSRRDLSRSGEPEGKSSQKKTTGGRRFVIQKHDASHMHYDVRLAIDGVLKSWAVPKGPSCNPRDKRLAIQTDDHPMAYAHFEGIIPEGSYGGGTVMIWDTGTYRNIKKEDGRLVPMHECVRRGTIEIFLTGKKLCGAYALIRAHLKGGKTAGNWLLIKMRDEHGTRCATKDASWQRSAVSGRTMKEIGGDARKAKAKKQSTKKKKA